MLRSFSVSLILFGYTCQMSVSPSPRVVLPDRYAMHISCSGSRDPVAFACPTRYSIHGLQFSKFPKMELSVPFYGIFE
jgi:hypothetical protein